MLDYDQMQLACRARALSLEVCTTGSISMSVSSDGFVRTTGSFLDDGLRAGMEVLGAGFANSANNARFTIESVTATLVSVTGASSESASTGRSLTVGLPSARAWENVEFEPTPGTPYVEEQFLYGPTRQVTVSPTGDLEARPIYVLDVSVPENRGIGATNGYVDGLVRHFRPLTAMVLDNGDVLKVRTDTGPFVGQKTRRKPGWMTAQVSFPCRLYTTNN